MTKRGNGLGVVSRADDLAKQRLPLVLRRFHGCISEEDSKLLDEIDAELDSIEMVEMKEDLDRLECAVEEQEHLCSDLASVLSDLAGE